ncbi:MAG TPA: response regulator transcription factor [Kiritimatiellia bacterium]|nr:response regulator transcription factor [Kiritimatiellia bacterium]HRZ13306.1 response regulator transcription factor [Kiritimatiellia bacterium]HSA18755.1 response regulator transcription factor [Kiritimatiellia bacterium]
MENAQKPARLLIVDDHPPLARQVEQLLRGEFDVVGTLTSGAALDTAVAELHPELIVMDITLPGASGIELARRLTARGCPARIVFLTVHADADYARESMTAGGLGYVIKPRLGSDLAPALRAAREGRSFVSPCPELVGLQGPGSST